MRLLMLLIPAFVASCGPTISQREVIGRARAEVALRESWSDQAMVLVDESPRYSWSTWRIRAGALDESSYPEYLGLQFVPGTEREMEFARNGCLIQYDHRTTGCNDRYVMSPPYSGK